MNKEEVKIEDIDIEPFDNDTWQGFKILWSGNIGFGEYTIYRDKTEKQWYGDSECMDSNDDKWFLSLLLNKLKEMITIDGRCD